MTGVVNGAPIQCQEKHQERRQQAGEGEEQEGQHEISGHIKGRYRCTALTGDLSGAFERRPNGDEKGAKGLPRGGSAQGGASEDPQPGASLLGEGDLGWGRQRRRAGHTGVHYPCLPRTKGGS